MFVCFGSCLVVLASRTLRMLACFVLFTLVYFNLQLFGVCYCLDEICLYVCLCGMCVLF